LFEINYQNQYNKTNLILNFLLMNLEEFQLRYMGYEGLNERFQLGWDEDTLVKLAARTDE
jgi:hypothetical protein